MSGSGTQWGLAEVRGCARGEPVDAGIGARAQPSASASSESQPQWSPCRRWRGEAIRQRSGPEIEAQIRVRHLLAVVEQLDDSRIGLDAREAMAAGGEPIERLSRHLDDGDPRGIREPRCTQSGMFGRRRTYRSWFGAMTGQA